MGNRTDAPLGATGTVEPTDDGRDTSGMPAALARLARGLELGQLDDLARALGEVEAMLATRGAHVALDLDGLTGTAVLHEACGRVLGLSEAEDVVRGLADAVRDQAASR